MCVWEMCGLIKDRRNLANEYSVFWLNFLILWLTRTILKHTCFNRLACIACNVLVYRPVGRAVTRSSLEREVWDSNLRPIKSYTVLPTARHCSNISSKGAVLRGRNDAETGLANSLHASAYYSEYNERFEFDLIWYSSVPIIDTTGVSG